MGAVWAALYWVLGVTLAGLPIAYEASNSMSSFDVSTFSKIYANQYKDLAIYTLVISGIALGDVFEAGRMSRNPDSIWQIPVWLMFFVLLGFVFLLATSFGQTLNGKQDGLAKLPALLLAMLYLTYPSHDCILVSSDASAREIVCCALMDHIYIDSGTRLILW